MLESAVLKVERANKHISDLNERINTIRQTDRHSLSVDVDPRTGKNALKVTAPPLPDAIPLLIGDAVHNLHSALDHLWCGTIQYLHGGPINRYAKFPVLKSRKEVEGTIERREVERLCGSEIVRFVLDEMRPYREGGGDSPVVALHDLDILDKHMLLIPVSGVTEITGVRLEDSEGPWAGWSGRPLNFKITAFGSVSVFGPDSSGTLEIKDKGKATLDIRFGEDQPLGGQSLIPALHNLSETVANAVEQFQAALARSGW